MEELIHREKTNDKIMKSPEVTPGWMSAAKLAQITGCDINIVRLILKNILRTLPREEEHVKDSMLESRHVRQYSPQSSAAVIDQLRNYPLVSPEYRTVKQLASIFRSAATREKIPEIIKALQAADQIHGKFFTGADDGLVKECFLAETRQDIKKFLVKLDEIKTEESIKD